MGVAKIKTYDVEVFEGDTWTKQLKFTMSDGAPYNFAGAGVSVYVDIRPSYTEAPVFELSSDSSGVTIDEDGTVTITVDRDNTEDLLDADQEKKTFVSDVQFYKAGPPAWSQVYVKLRWVVNPKATHNPVGVL